MVFMCHLFFLGCSGVHSCDANAFLKDFRNDASVNRIVPKMATLKVGPVKLLNFSLHQSCYSKSVFLGHFLWLATINVTDMVNSLNSSPILQEIVKEINLRRE